MFKSLRKRPSEAESILHENRKQQAKLIGTMEEMEKAVMNGEHEWFLVPCEKPQEPVCANPFAEELGNVP